MYGAGGHGKVVADILISRGDNKFAGFVDDREQLKGATVLGYQVHGDGQWLRQEALRSPVAVALGVGAADSRQFLFDRCSNWGIEILTLLHPSAVVSKAAALGRGTAVMAGAVVNAEAKIGVGVIVNSGAVVEHDVEIGDYAHVAPNATMGGSSRLGSFSHLGLGATVLQSIEIGCHTIIGAGAVVTKNFPDHIVAVGVPARIHRRVQLAGVISMAASSGRKLC